ncbi:MAG: four helix bundle protein [Chloroflexi bacterium]|nr:four helix bundle protein [Chloroflexota bacterium]
MVRDDNLIQVKSYAFAVRVVRLYQYLSTEKKEYTLSRQLLRSGTSIGANVEEGIGGQSRADFFSKLAIAYKESRETAYWLRLLKDTDYLSESEFNSIYPEALELCRLLGAVQKTAKGTGKKELRL